MLWRVVCVCVCVATALCLLPAQLDAFVAHSTGCHHNGTWYADKSLVPTMEKCLNCQCNKKTLVCRLKVCPEMPMPPPRGCVVVQQKSTCCPYLSCARLESFYKIPITRRIIQYLDHYERESIDRVVNENMLQRRSDDSEVDTHVCVKNGTVYKSGSAMSSSNLCTYCYCIGGTEKCVKPKCMLPVEGCKPIFVDSTCCPVRYDCSSKTSGKSSQEVRYRKTSNKHFLRMSQRLQRNRGCSAGKQFYVEGQKMKSDPDKPCDICFCIRGSRRCAPKKCSPPLKNCIPVVPKGQCCPSSYDCGSQRDYRRADSSRQFNLFSLFFGKDESGEGNTTEIPVQYPHDRHPSVTAPDKTHKTHQKITMNNLNEKSIFDTIREGLEFIDSNNDKLLVENLDLLALGSEGVPQHVKVSAPSTIAPASQPPPPETKESTSTEVSFLDLILGPSEPTEQNKVPTRVPTQVPLIQASTTPYEELSWVDLLLGAVDEDDKNTRGDNVENLRLDLTETTTNEQLNNDLIATTNIDRIDDNVATDVDNIGEILVDSDVTEQKQEIDSTTETSYTDSTTEWSTIKNIVDTTDSTTTDDTTHTTYTTIREDESTTLPTTTTKTITTTTAKPTTSTKPTVRVRIPSRGTALPTRKIYPAPTNLKTNTTAHTKVISPHQSTNIPQQVKITELPAHKNETVQKLAQKNGLLSALLDGITDILSVEKLNNKTVVKVVNTHNVTPTTTVNENATTSSTLVTSAPLPLFKPLPSHKPHTRINSKIANITTNPSFVRHKQTSSSTTVRPTVTPELIKLTSITTPISKKTEITTTTVTTNMNSNYMKITTVKPLIIKTNPTILEAEPLDQDAEPTLPPSLPNVKIIPFELKDAVKPTQQISRIDYDLYDDANLYPAITERFPTYAEVDDDGGKAEYIYKFKVEGPAPASVTSTSVKLDGPVGSTAYVKYDFGVVNGVPSTGFSPPTKTEGGFVPKEPFIIDDEVENSHSPALNYQVTKHVIDITTSEPTRENTTKIIEITTPDPFKDVIHTEPPPDLISLIEDKTHLLQNQQATTTNSEIHKPSQITVERPNMPDRIVNNDNNSGVDKNTIESLLNLLFNDDQEELSVLQETVAAVSDIPPFRTLPQLPLEANTNTTAKKKQAAITTTATTTTSRPNRPKLPATVNRIKTKPTTTITTTQKRRGTTTTTTTTTKPNTTTSKFIKTNRIKTKPTVATTTTTTATTRTSTNKPATIPHIPTTPSKLVTPSTTTTTKSPHLPSPFDKLPFMDASYEIRPNTLAPPVAALQTQSGSVFDFSHYMNSLNHIEGLEPAYERFPSDGDIFGYDNSDTAGRGTNTITTTTTTTTTTTSAPQHSSLSAHLQQQQQQQSGSVGNNGNSLIDPTGILKLAGCNIYGRMYRVGRIILELSSACEECKCTEVGVKCDRLCS